MALTEDMASMPTPATGLLATGEAQEVILRRVMDKAMEAAHPMQLQEHKMALTGLLMEHTEEQKAIR